MPLIWGFPPCKAVPLHYLSDGYFNGRWSHGLEGEMARILIKAGATIDDTDASGSTHLHGAASLGCKAVADVLILSGANLEAKAEYPEIPDGTPLDFAVHFGMEQIVDLLVQHGAEIISPRMAAGVGRISLIESLSGGLNECSERAAADIYRCASVCNRVEVVDHLISVGVEVDLDIKGASALHWAAWEAKLEMAKHLVHIGADTRALDQRHHMSPLQWAQHRRSEVGAHWGHDKVIGFLAEIS